MGISKKMQLEEMDRISRLEYDEDGRAKNDDAAFWLRSLKAFKKRLTRRINNG